MSDSLKSCIQLPDGAGLTLRRSLGLRFDETPRIAYVPGPGDVVGTFDHWMAGKFDPRVPVIAYSTMFYELISSLNADALVLSEPENDPVRSDPRIRFVKIPRARPSGRFEYWANNLHFSHRVMRELRAYRPHIVLLATDAPQPLLAFIPAGMKLVLTAHNTYWPMGRMPRSWKARLKLSMTKLSLRRVSSGVCTSPECRNQLQTMCRSDVDLIVETPQVLSCFSRPVRHSLKASRLLYLGRIETEKGVFDLLDAFEALAPVHPDIRLDFAGTGSALGPLQARIASSIYSDRMRYLGQLSAPDVHAILDECDLLICPTRSSFNEGLALVVIEAAVHGVPTLLSSVVPAKDIVGDACLVFPADDAAALRDRMNEVIQDPLRFQWLRERVVIGRDAFTDRTRSWGTQLYRAFVHQPV